MTVPEPLKSFVQPLTALQRLLDRFSAQGVIIGGIATGFLGKPRFTVDLDAMFFASIKDVPRILEMAKAEGIEPRTDKVMEFAQKSRVLLLRHSSSGASIDISLGVLPFEEEVVARSKVHGAESQTSSIFPSQQRVLGWNFACHISGQALFRSDESASAGLR